MNLILKILLLSSFVILGYSGRCQSVLSYTPDGSEQGKSLKNFIEELEGKLTVRFYFEEAWIEGITIENSYAGKTLQFMLDDIFAVSDLTYLEFNSHAIVLIRNPEPGMKRKLIVDSIMRRQSDLSKVVFGTPQSYDRKKKIIINGTLLDLQTRRPLGGTNVIVNDLHTVSTADENGKYTIDLPPGEHILTFSRVNYDNESVVVEAYENGKVDAMLTESAIMLSEVVVTESANKEITTSRIGLTTLNVTDMKRQPALLGEIDIGRQIQQQPGVTTAGEASTGFNVRGGGADQNLIQYDQIPIFNTSHLFGFFSSFNSDNIKEATFLKGGIPAEFGGKVSSVLNIKSKDGSYEKWGGSGGIGLISSYLTIGGPLRKDTSSLSLSFRTTYSQQLVNSIRTNYVDLTNSLVKFYDGAVKYSRRMGKNTRLSLSAYHSSDQFRLSGDSTYQWTNWATSVRVDHFFSPDFSASFVAGWGAYAYKVTSSSVTSGFDLSYQNSYPVFKTDFNYQTERHKFSFGLQSQLYIFNPGTLQPAAQSSVKYVKMDEQHSLESGIYFGDAFTLNPRTTVEAGLRLSIFNSMGPANVAYYKNGSTRSLANIDYVDSIRDGQIYNTYVGLEPRLSAVYSIDGNSSVKFGYNRMYQYLHLITNTVAITPVDIWQPSNPYFKPEVADQFSAGYFRSLKSKKYEVSAEVFYKNIENILDYKDGSKLLLNPNLETSLLQGRGISYGIETSISKITGKLTGNLNYTYSRSLRKISGPFPEEKINNGNWFPANYDQPHIVNLSWRLALSRRHYFTGNFTYHTGRPVSIPLSSSIVDGVPFTNFSDRNQYRIADYHRLDIGFVIEGNHRRKKIWDGTWTVSVYNLYARKNPYTVFFKSGPDGAFTAYQLSILGTALPSVSYSLKF